MYTMNLEKRIKRHVIGKRLNLYAVTLPGYESICSAEIERLSETIALGQPNRGGVAFSGRLLDVYRSNLHVRSAGRILIRLGSFKATNFHQLEIRAAAVAWSLWLPSGAVPLCHVATHHSRLRHTRAIADRLTGQVAAHWIEAGISPVETAKQNLYVRLQDDRVTLSLDSTGPNLYRRGLKTHEARAPLRETMAAIILKKAGYRPQRPLVDPMCGAGTFSLEAALMAKGIAPGLQRRFAFMHWPAFRPRQWAHLTGSASQRIRTMGPALIWASDINADSCRQLTATVHQHHLQDAVKVRQKDFFDIDPMTYGKKPGLVVLNPPYGRRLSAETEIRQFYQRMAAKLIEDFKDWRVALIAPQQSWAHRLPPQLQSFPLSHGGLKLTLLTGRL